MLRATIVILILNMLSKVLGFIRDAVIVMEFGAGGVTDAYLVAYTLPYALQAVLGMSFVTVIVPVLTGYLVRGEEKEGALVASTVVNGTGIILTVLTIIGVLISPWLVKLLAPGFGQEQLTLAIRLTKIMFPSIIFMGLGLMLTGILNAHKIFAVPAFAPSVANIAVILAVLLVGGKYKIDGLAIGTLAGFMGFLLIQVPAIKKLTLGFKKAFDWKHPEVKKLALAVLPVTFAIAVNQINLAMNRYFASLSLPPGSITALDYANRVMNLPLGIFAAAVATVAFPALAAKGAAKDWQGFGQEFSASFRLMSFTMLPAGVGLLVLREPVVRLLFERKAFTPEATLMTSQALLYFCLGLWFLGALYLLTRAYYSFGDLKTPAVVGLVAIIANGIFSLIFLNWLGHRGLALANTLAAGVNGILLFYLLKKRVPQWKPQELLSPLSKMVLAAALMGAGVNFVHLFWGGFASFWLEAGAVLALALLGVVTYAAAVLLLKVEEGGRILKMLRHF